MGGEGGVMALTRTAGRYPQPATRARSTSSLCFPWREAEALQNFLARIGQNEFGEFGRSRRRPCDHGEAVIGPDREFGGKRHDLLVGVLLLGFCRRGAI